jgi:hypothetical protein
MKLSISEIQVLCGKVLHSLALDYEQSITIKDDFYWFIPKNELYDPSRDPKSLTLGQLSFDFDDLNFREEFIPNDLIRLSSLLRYLGERLTDMD